MRQSGHGVFQTEPQKQRGGSPHQRPSSCLFYLMAEATLQLGHLPTVQFSSLTADACVGWDLGTLM